MNATSLLTDRNLAPHLSVLNDPATARQLAVQDASQPPARETNRMDSKFLANRALARTSAVWIASAVVFLMSSTSANAQSGTRGYTQPYSGAIDPYAQTGQAYAQPAPQYPAAQYPAPQYPAAQQYNQTTQQYNQTTQPYVPPPVVGVQTAPPTTSSFPPQGFGPNAPQRRRAYAPGDAVPGLGDSFPPLGTDPVYTLEPKVRVADLIVNGFPARTGRIMFGGAVNSDAGVTGQITIDERNFNISRWPRSIGDLFGGNAFRGAGQTFRVEAAPGSDFDRYTVQFADPNLFGYLPISFSTSGFLYDRRYNDWDENRLGARFSLGYRITPDLSVSGGIGGQRVKFDPNIIIPGETDIDRETNLFSASLGLTHNTVDSPIQASQGHYFELSLEHNFGDQTFNKIDLEYRKYWLLASRADGSGKQTLSYSNKTGFITGGGDSGAPIFERYYAGGYATMRGFDFREMGPAVDVGVPGASRFVFTGGNFQFLNTVEYMFPITADDAFRGVAFCDFGTVESSTKFDADSFRVAPGVGLRVAIPALGPAPLAFDFAFPVANATQDQERVFSFYMSLIR